MKREKRTNKLLGNEKKPKKTKLIKSLRLRSGGKKVSKMMQSLRKTIDVEEESDGVVLKEDEHKWGESAVTEAIGRMIRANRMERENREEKNCIMNAQLNCSEDAYSSPLRRRGGDEIISNNDFLSRLISSENSVDNVIESPRSHGSRIRRWERRAVRHLQASQRPHIVQVFGFTHLEQSILIRVSYQFTYFCKLFYSFKSSILHII